MKRVKVEAFDDLDWTEKRVETVASNTATVGWEGRWVELDLTEAHAVEVASFMSRLMAAGTALAKPPGASHAGSPMSAAHARNVAMHSWAVVNGWPVTDTKAGGWYFPVKTRRAYDAAMAAAADGRAE